MMSIECRQYIFQLSHIIYIFQILYKMHKNISSLTCCLRTPWWRTWNCYTRSRWIRWRRSGTMIWSSTTQCSRCRCRTTYISYFRKQISQIRISISKINQKEENFSNYLKIVNNVKRLTLNYLTLKVWDSAVVRRDVPQSVSTNY